MEAVKQKMRFQGMDPEILYAPNASYEQPRKTASAKKYLKMFDVVCFELQNMGRTY